jgi:hypothetical protein
MSGLNRPDCVQLISATSYLVSRTEKPRNRAAGNRRWGVMGAIQPSESSIWRKVLDIRLIKSYSKLKQDNSLLRLVEPKEG